METLYTAMMDMVRERPHTRFVESSPGDIDRTFTALLQALNDGIS
jgi:hypothetical protein